MSPFLILVFAVFGLIVWRAVSLSGKAAPKSSDGYAGGCLCWLIGVFGTMYLVTAMFQAEWFGRMSAETAALSGAFYGIPAGVVVSLLLNLGLSASLKKRSRTQPP